MYDFHTPEPVQLRLEFGAGDILIAATETERSTVEVIARRDDEATREAVAETRVEQRGDTIVIEGLRRSTFFRRGPQLELHITVPEHSILQAKIESADVTVTGAMSDVDVKTGSGDVRLDTVSGDASIQTGSGDVEIEHAGRSTRVQGGSSDVQIREADGSLTASTGSGDIEIGRVAGRVQVNSGSGDVQIREPGPEVAVNTASGDQSIGRVSQGSVRANAASGDIRVGVAAGTAAWLSINSLSGSVSSELDGAEEPQPGEETVEIRVNTVSGDINLTRA